MPECIHHSGGSSIDQSSVSALFNAGIKSFCHSTILLTNRIGILVPVVILQVGILVP